MTKLVCTTAMIAALWLSLAASTPARAQVWTQTDWSGGPGQLSWSDTTMYYTGAHVDGWRSPGDLMLHTPDDSNWLATGDLSGASYVRSLMVASDGTLYAGTSLNGDVFRSTNAGSTWVNTGDLLGAIHAYSQLEASDGAFYVGTGDSGEVFKSTDAGTTWVNTGDLAGATDVRSLAEASDGALYAGTGLNGDVFKSTDAGTSWVNTGDLSGAFYAYYVVELSNGTLHAGTGPGGDVFESVDGGATWANTGQLAGATQAWSEIELSDGTLYVGSGADGDVFKSTDGGTTWMNTGDLLNANHATKVIVTSDATLYAATTAIWGDVFKSTDAGTTWVNTGDLTGANSVLSLMEASDGALYAGTYPDGHVFRAGYCLNGDLVSSVYQTENASVLYGIMTWSETLNGQTVVLRVRTDTLPDMSTAPVWNSCPPVANGQDISGLSSVDDHDQYIQYRAELATTTSHVTPLLHEVAIQYVVDMQGPAPDSAVASDGTNPVPGIDDDDYVTIAFDDSTNKPAIDAANVDQVLQLSGGHSWLDGLFGIGAANWNPAGNALVVLLSTNVSPPTVAVGDTITPDGITITDVWGNPCTTQVVITGSFDPPGVQEITSHRLPVAGCRLHQNFPNPFSGSTAIQFSISNFQFPISLTVYDLSGRLVRTLVDEPSNHRTIQPSNGVEWDGTNGRGERVGSGIYFYRLRVGGETATRKLILLR